MSDRETSAGVSVRVMVLGVMLLAAYIGWALAASSYLEPLIEVGESNAGEFRYGRSTAIRAFVASTISFLGNSLQVHKAPAIITHVLRNERWIPGLFVVAETMAVVFGVWVKMLDARLNAPRKKGRKRPLSGPRAETPRRTTRR